LDRVLLIAWFGLVLVNPPFMAAFARILREVWSDWAVSPAVLGLVVGIWLFVRECKRGLNCGAAALGIASGTLATAGLFGLAMFLALVVDQLLS
jgi:hypothetical protein